MGKRPTSLIINKNKFFVIEIDPGKEKLKMDLLNMREELIEKYTGSIISKDNNARNRTVSEVKDFIKKYAKNRNSYNIKSICIDVPATINTNTKRERVVSASHYRDWEWKDFNLKNIITNEFEIPVFVENDANLSAIGEKHYGEGKKYNNII